MEVLINPPGMDELNLRNLNISYGKWGDKELYNWCFHRNIGDIQTDLLVIKKENKIVYGTAIHYRNAILVDNNKVKIALIGSGWTLPESRRLGISTYGISESLKVAKENGCSFLIGFVKRNNTSYNNMVANNGNIQSSFYCMFEKRKRSSISNSGMYEIEITKETINNIFHQSKLLNEKGLSKIIYQKEEWISQYIERPGVIRIFALEDETGYCIVEETSSEVKILGTIFDTQEFHEKLLKDILSFDRYRESPIFYYTTLRNELDTAMRFGAKYIEGAISIFPNSINQDKINEQIPKDSDGLNMNFRKNIWKILNGDRM